VAFLAILSNQGLLPGMERFAKRYRKTRNDLLGTQIANPPSDSTSSCCFLSSMSVALTPCCSSGWQPFLASPSASTRW
jgi:hypothetical protein